PIWNQCHHLLWTSYLSIRRNRNRQRTCISGNHRRCQFAFHHCRYSICRSTRPPVSPYDRAVRYRCFTGTLWSALLSRNDRGSGPVDSDAGVYFVLCLLGWTRYLDCSQRNLSNRGARESGFNLYACALYCCRSREPVLSGTPGSSGRRRYVLGICTFQSCEFLLQLEGGEGDKRQNA